MKIEDIQKRVDGICRAMLDKGLRQPEARFWVESNAEFLVYLTWKEGASGALRDDRSEMYRGKTAEPLFRKADTFVSKLPDKETARRNTFLNALGKVIDLGNELGQDVGALMSEMKRISENAITDGRGIQPAE